MGKTATLTESSDLYRKISELRLPAAQKSRALAAAVKVEQLMYFVDFAARILRFTPEERAPNHQLRHPL